MPVLVYERGFLGDSYTKRAILVYEARTCDGKSTDRGRKEHGPGTETSGPGTGRILMSDAGFFGENDYICELRTKVHKI